MAEKALPAAGSHRIFETLKSWLDSNNLKSGQCMEFTYPNVQDQCPSFLNPTVTMK